MCLWRVLTQGDKESHILRMRNGSWYIAAHVTGSGESKEGREGGKEQSKVRSLALSLIIFAVKRAGVTDQIRVGWG